MVECTKIKGYDDHSSEYYYSLRRLNLGVPMRSGLRPLGLSHPCRKHATTIQLHMVFPLTMNPMLKPFHPCRHYTITECQRDIHNSTKAHAHTPLFCDPCVVPKSIIANLTSAYIITPVTHSLVATTLPCSYKLCNTAFKSFRTDIAAVIIVQICLQSHYRSQTDFACRNYPTVVTSAPNINISDRSMKPIYHVLIRSLLLRSLQNLTSNHVTLSLPDSFICWNCLPYDAHIKNKFHRLI